MTYWLYRRGSFIARAIVFAGTAYQEKIEGSAAVARAAVLEEKRVRTYPCLVILTGGNIEPEVHEKIVMQRAGRL